MKICSLYSHKPELPGASPDGLVRIPAKIFELIPLVHLDSGVYSPEDQAQSQDRCQCIIAGYTEWYSETAPSLSLSWDWTLTTSTSPPKPVKHGDLFTNLLLQSDTNEDFSDRDNFDALDLIIERMDWESSVQQFIARKYS